MTDRELMQQALEALQKIYIAPEHEEYIRVWWPACEDAITALQERLAQTERHELQAKGEHPAPCARHCEANAFQIVIKNLKAQLAQPEQEPVAWMWRCKPYCDWPNWSVSLTRPADSGRDGNKPTDGYEDIPLYTAPPQRTWVGLTDKRITQVIDSMPNKFAGFMVDWDLYEFTRAIEAAHGIKENT